MQKERDLELAAKIGQTLLTKNQELSEKNDVLEEQLVLLSEKVIEETYRLDGACMYFNYYVWFLCTLCSHTLLLSCHPSFFLFLISKTKSQYMNFRSKSNFLAYLYIMIILLTLCLTNVYGVFVGKPNQT